MHITFGAQWLPLDPSSSADGKLSFLRRGKRERELHTGMAENLLADRAVRKVLHNTSNDIKLSLETPRGQHSKVMIQIDRQPEDLPDALQAFTRPQILFEIENT